MYDVNKEFYPNDSGWLGYGNVSGLYCEMCVAFCCILTVWVYFFVGVLTQCKVSML